MANKTAPKGLKDLKANGSAEELRAALEAVIDHHDKMVDALCGISPEVRAVVELMEGQAQYKALQAKFKSKDARPLRALRGE